MQSGSNPATVHHSTSSGPFTQNTFAHKTQDTGHRMFYQCVLTNYFLNYCHMQDAVVRVRFDSLFFVLKWNKQKFALCFFFSFVEFWGHFWVWVLGFMWWKSSRSWLVADDVINELISLELWQTPCAQLWNMTQRCPHDYCTYNSLFFISSLVFGSLYFSQIPARSKSDK